MSCSVADKGIAAVVVGDHEDGDADSGQPLKQVRHDGRDGTRFGRGSDGAVAMPKAEAACHDRGLPFAFGYQNTIQARNKTLLAGLRKVHIDRSALSHRCTGADVLRYFHDEAASGRYGIRAIAIRIGTHGDIDVVENGWLPVGPISQTGKIQVQDVARQITRVRAIAFAWRC